MRTLQLLRLGLFLSNVVPHPVNNVLCNLFGIMTYALRPSIRRIVMSNQRRVLDTGNPVVLHWQVIRVAANAFRNYYSLLRIFRLSNTAIEELVVLRGEEHLQRALDAGRGAVLLGAHMSNYNLLAPYMALYSARAGAFVEPVEPPELFEFVSTLRARTGLRLFMATREGVRDAMTLLRHNGILAVTGDRYLGASGTVVEFFGAPAPLPHGAVVLAQRTGAPLIPARLRQIPGGRLLVNLDMPLELQATGSPREDLAVNMRRVARALERTVAEAPEQWVILNPVWPDTTPEPLWSSDTPRPARPVERPAGRRPECAGGTKQGSVPSKH